MADLRIHKVVGSLPQTLEAHAFYAVLETGGYSLYLTDASGVAEPMRGTREWVGTQTEYDALSPVDETVTYFIIPG